MPIPYKIKRLRPGRLKINSDLFRLLHHPQESLQAFFGRFGGVRYAKYVKESGNLVIDYDPDQFDLIGFLSYLHTSTPEIFLEDLEREKKLVQPTRKSTASWFKVNSLAMLLYLTPLPRALLSAITLMCSLPVFKKGLRSLFEKRLDVHVLDSSAIVLTTLSGNPFSAHLMSWLLSLGDYIEEKIEKKAYESIESLVSYKKDKAWLVEGEKIKKVDAKELKVGDVIVVYAGEKITADGVVLEGEALVNQASLTGESNPVLKSSKDKVYAGTFVEEGKLYIQVSAVGEETVIASIVKLIEKNIKEPLSLQKKAEVAANRFVLPTVGLGVGSYALTQDLNRIASTLIIDYHTGIHLATPVAVLSSISYLASKGIIVKSGSKLELLAKADTFVMDKTGTLTVGHPEIIDILGFDVPEEEVLLYAASLEQRITHPVARAIVKLAKDRNIEPLPRRDSSYHIGLGIEGYLNGDKFLLGSTKFMQKKKIKIGEEVKHMVDKFHSEGKSVLYLVRNKRIIGLITFADPLREEAKDVISALTEMGKKVILCTGDNEGVASYIAKRLNIGEYYGRAFPEEKAKIVESLKKEGRTVAFVGDGVNDSPAITAAHVGISLRSGTDIAIELADIVIGDSLWHLLDAVEVSQKTIRKLSKIYTINSALNTVGLVGSVAGLFGPSISTLINNGSTVVLGMYALKKP
ncbi:heavy metal translocating P-type ATPase [Thermocrinis sp.]|uniref:heavy metal translocating P-type ATPase n=1 Tax=Thermocrinis sp. TaxID=2024383 RepID=UPI002FDCC494